MRHQVKIFCTDGRKYSVFMEPGRWIEVQGIRLPWVMATAVREMVRGDTGYYETEAPPRGAVDTRVP